jgi:mannose-6-phosphate isomerase-like protein (cupin superfamily)
MTNSVMQIREACKNYGMEPTQPAQDITHTKYDGMHAYTTKDGSTIRELLHPDSSAARNQSFAEAIVEIGQTTMLHLHHTSEEIYHITAGTGLMILGAEEFPVTIGDSIVIRPGTPHAITNTGVTPLKILCACSPAYAHDDTVLL